MSDTLLSARAELRSNLDNGVTCPCCDQYAKRYRRKLSGSMVRWLACLVKISDGSGTHARDVFKRLGARGSNANDDNYLQHWGLIKPEETLFDGRRSGYWLPTDLGIDFVRGLVSVREKIVLYNNKFEGFDGDLISILVASKNKFNYAEL